jgi:hypothetical protein
VKRKFTQFSLYFRYKSSFFHFLQTALTENRTAELSDHPLTQQLLASLRSAEALAGGGSVGELNLDRIRWVARRYPR